MHILKQLKTKKGRDESGLFVIEGTTSVAEIPPDWEVIRYIFSESYIMGIASTPSDVVANAPRTAREVEISYYKQSAPTEILPDNRFASYSDTQTPQGIAAICRQKRYTLDNILSKNPADPLDLLFEIEDLGNNGFVHIPAVAAPFYLLCEALQDPGNVGTLIRTAAAAGASAVILTPGSADPYNPKVLRAAAGAVLRLPVINDIPFHEILPRLKLNQIPLYAAHPRGTVLPYKLDMKKSFCLLIGNEAQGLSEEAQAAADALVHLPMADVSESLNAATAGSILLYEAVRQRGYNPTKR